MKILQTFCLCGLLAFATESVSQAFKVLSYHDVRDDITEDLVISTDTLTSHFAWLKEQGYHPVSIDDLLAAQKGKKPYLKNLYC